MLLAIVGLVFAVSTAASLLMGRLLGRAYEEHTVRPGLKHGPALEARIQSRRMQIAAQAARQRTISVHLN